MGPRRGAFALAQTLAALAFAGFAASGCGAPDKPVAHAPAARASDLDAAFATAFGGPSPAVRVVQRDGEATTLRYRPVKLVTLDTRDVVLISEARSDGCHGCSGTLAAHYLVRNADGFTLKSAWPEMLVGGSFGEPPHWSIRNDLFSGPVIEAHAGGTWQGCTVDYADLVELGATQPIPRLKHVLMYYDNDTDADSAIEGKLRAEVKDHAFAVDYSGAHTRTVEYRATGDAFSPVRDEPSLPSC
jgi:hypothetical protein